MKYGNLIPEEKEFLNEDEINIITNMFPASFKIVSVKNGSETLFGTYIDFEFKPCQTEFRNNDSDLIKFNLDSKGYCKGYLNVCKEVSGKLQDEEKSFVNGAGLMYSDENWHGIQYARSIHISAKIRGYHCKTWEESSISELVENFDISNYEFDTDLDNLNIAEILSAIQEKYILSK